MRMSTCKGCGKQLAKGEKLTYSSKTYCKECYDEKIRNKEEYDDAVSRIHDYFNLGVLNTLILKQLKDYVEDYGYTYSGIIYCLWYITEIRKVKLEVKYGIAMVKYEYENAKRYFTEQNRIQNSVDKIENHKINVIHRECKINRVDKRSNILFDLDAI